MSLEIESHRAKLPIAERELARMQRRLDLVFLRLFLQRRIRRISPLLVDLMVDERLRIDRLLQRICPRSERSRSASQIGRYVVPMTHWRYLLPSGWQPELSTEQMDLLFRDAMSARGVVVRLPSHPKGHLGISTSAEQLEVEFGDAQVRVWTHGDDAFALLRFALPESVGISVVGRPIGDVVGHPVLSGRGYPITECRISEPPGERVATTTIRFRVGHLPFQMPFHALVEDLARRAGLRRPRSPQRG